MPPLSYMSIANTHYEEAKFVWTKHNRVAHYITAKIENVPIVHCSTLTPEDTFNAVTNFCNDEDVKDNDIKADVEMTVNEVTTSTFDLEKDDFLAESTSNVDLGDSFIDNDDTFNSDNEPDDFTERNSEGKTDNADGVDGSNLDEEYAMMIPISVKEAKAAIEVYKLFSHGKHLCEICNKGYFSEKRKKVHMRMHDKVII